MLILAPQLFAGQVEIGVIYQSGVAFDSIVGGLSVIIYQFENISAYCANMERLSDFYETMKYADIYRRNHQQHDRSLLSPGIMIGSTMSTSPFNHLNRQSTHSSTSSIDELDAMTALTIREHDEMDSSNTGIVNHFSFIDLQRWKPLIYSDPPIDENIDTATLHSSKSISILSLQQVDLCTPDKKRLLIQNLSFSLRPLEHMLIVGSSGIGKSSLLRAIAGLWNIGNGIIRRPADDDVYFLPQRPYCTVGTLKDQLLYPSIEYNDGNENDHQYHNHTKQSRSSQKRHFVARYRMLKESWNDEDLLDILDQVDLYNIAVRSDPIGGNPIRGLYSIQDWSNQLSLGEQQRLAFGRLLVNKPSLVILDEAVR
jgi:ABC-type uncharacterized transport system fused permease/ATPase subunit